MIGIPLIFVGLILVTVGIMLRRGVSFPGGPGSKGPDPKPIAPNKGGGPIFAVGIGLAAIAFGLYTLIGGRWG